MASATKASVAEYFADRGIVAGEQRRPRHHHAAHRQVRVGIDIADGTITITYGNDANQAITGADNKLSLRPALTPNGDVVWSCGGRALSVSVSLNTAGADASTILGKYRPSSCRP